MTHSIDQWHRPLNVKAVQTTQTLAQHQAFDIRPNHAKPNQIHQFQREFALPHTPYFLQQAHGNQVIEYKNPPKTHFIHQADACFTRSKNVICAVMTADCLPVLITDTAKSFVAAVHCGWRSLFANILIKTMEQINSKHQILVWLGPCIQQAQYEVDSSFVLNYLAQHPNCHSAFTDVVNGKCHACLQTLAKIQLLKLGINHIESTDQCTFLNPEYCSWRQNNSQQRMASLVWLTN